MLVILLGVVIKDIVVMFYMFVVNVLFGGCGRLLVARFLFAVCHTNRRNKGLISVDRRTSLLSYVQYPVPYQSRLQRIYRSQCPKGD